MNESACTSILVGKKATIDGSTMIARNDDTFLPLTHSDQQNNHPKSQKCKDKYLSPFHASG